ncbi:MAG: transposase domain-containing protein [Myxococcota bacterium]
MLPAKGRDWPKHYLYAGSRAAARRAATFYTFLETCRLIGVDPVDWLTDVLPRIHLIRKSELHALLPARGRPLEARAQPPRSTATPG